MPRRAKTPAQQALLAQGLMECAKCKAVKELDEFSVDRRVELGFTQPCKACQSAAHAINVRKWREKNTPKTLAQAMPKKAVSVTAVNAEKPSKFQPFSATAHSPIFFQIGTMWAACFRHAQEWGLENDFDALICSLYADGCEGEVQEKEVLNGLKQWLGRK